MKPYHYKPVYTFLIFSSVFLGGTLRTQAMTSPSSSIIKIFEMRASVNSDCSGAVTIFKSVSATPIDLVAQSNFGSGDIPHGTYHCLMFHVSDLVTVVPQTTDGACAAGAPVVLDFFRDVVNDVSITPEGTTIHANPNAEDDPWVYFSDSTQALATNNCFEPNTSGCACSGPCPLTPMTVSEDLTRHLVINLDNKIDGVTTGQCALLVPVMSIR